MSRRMVQAATMDAPNLGFAFEEASGMIEEYTGLLTEANTTLREAHDIEHTGAVLALSHRLRNVIRMVEYLEQILDRTMYTMWKPGFAHQSARCFADCHVMTIHHFATGLLTCMKYVDHANETVIGDGGLGNICPDGCYYQLVKLADMHDGPNFPQYYGDTNLEVYLGGGPKAHLRDISIASGRAMRELVETNRVVLGICELMWTFPDRNSSMAQSEIFQNS